MSKLDLRGREVCRNLAATYNLPDEVPDPVQGCIPIGAEVEIKFSTVFPEIWKSFGLEGKGFGGLSASESDAFTQACTDAEKLVLPRLHASVAAGVPRGNDRYWEFAFDPVHDVGLLAQQVAHLSDAGVLPRESRHSLQVTLGDLRATPDVYYLAMLLELQTVDPERIAYGLEQTRKTIFTGWARKGRSGVFEKGAEDLKHGSTVACELRPLQLPETRTAFDRLLSDTSWAANAIAVKQGVRDLTDADGLERWNDFVAQAKKALMDHNLPDRNWGGGRDIDHSAWTSFADQLQEIRSTLLPDPKKLRLRL